MVAAHNGSNVRQGPAWHAEARLSRKLDFYSVVYVARATSDGTEFGLARPCEGCQRALRRKRVERVYYSINADEYGVMELG